MEKKLKHLFNDKKTYDIFIVRHPEVENHKKNIFNGTTDVDLSQKGYNQAEILYDFFKDKNIKVVFSSPMKRCITVAEKFKETCRVIIKNNLKERNFGIFEGLSWENVEELYPKTAKDFLSDPFFYRVKNGESFFDVKKRVIPEINKILKVGENTLIVAHGGINRVIISYLLDMKDESVLKISQDYACINHFITDGDFVLCKTVNFKLPENLS